MGNDLDSSGIGIENKEFLEFGHVDGAGKVDGVRDAC